MSLAVGVFGVTGVGKSTLLDRHVATYPADRHVGGSPVIRALIAPASVHDFDGWSDAAQARIRRKATAQLRVMRDCTRGALLVAGHFSLRNRVTGSLEAVLTEQDHGFFDALVLLDGKAPRVLSQTVKDPRPRHGQELDAIQEHLDFERTLAATTAAHMSVPVLSITTPSLDARLAELRCFLTDLRTEGTK